MRHIAWMVCVGVLVAATALRAETEVEQLRRENAQLKQRIAELEAAVAQLRQEKQQVLAESRQQVTASRAHLLERRHDAAAATTTFATRQTPLNVTVGPPRNQWLSFTATRAEGEKAAEPRVIATIETRFSGGVYRNAGQVVLTADGQAVPLKVISYDARARRAGGATRATTRQDDETLKFELTPQQLKTLAAAKQVDAQAGYVKFSLTPEQVQSLRMLQEELSGQ